MKKIALFLVSLFTATFAFAYDVEIDGIYYNLDSHEYFYYVANTFKDSVERTATVTSGYNDNYSGDIVIPEKVTYNGAEYNVTSIGWGAFKGSPSLSSITIPSSITSMSGDAFEGTAWFNNQPDGCVYINNNILYAYKGEMPENTHIDINEGTTMICGDAFYSRSHLTSIIIPDSVTSIGSRAFSDCDALTSVTIDSIIPPSLQYEVFNNTPSNLQIYVPDESVNAYKTTIGWSEYADKIKPISEKPA
jgi:hypothetical protein